MKASSVDTSESLSASTSSSKKQQALSKEISNHPIGTLWFMPRSPFSNAVLAVNHISGTTLHRKLYVAILSSFVMLFRLGFRDGFRRKITAPIMRNLSGVYLRDSFDIAKYIDSKRESWKHSLFPQSNLSELYMFNQHAERIIGFGRAQLVGRLRSDPATVEQLYMPRFLQNRFFSSTLARICLSVFMSKYKQENEIATRQRARESLEAIRDALKSYTGKRLRHVCGEQLSYADIILAESIYFDTERHGRKGYIYQDDEFSNAFPDLIAWARAIRQTYYGDLTIRSSS